MTIFGMILDIFNGELVMLQNMLDCLNSNSEHINYTWY